MNRDGGGGGGEEEKRGSFSSRPRILCQTSLAVQDGAKALGRDVIGFFKLNSDLEN